MGKVSRYLFGAFLFFLLFALLCFEYHRLNVFPFSDAILAITATLIIWYSLETAKMRDEISLQSKFSLMPCVIFEERDRKFWLVNSGGPALNVTLADIYLDQFTNFSFTSYCFMSRNTEKEVLPKPKLNHAYSDNFYVLWSGAWGADDVFEVKINYKDLVGRKYETIMKVGKCNHEVLRIGEIS